MDIKCQDSSQIRGRGLEGVPANLAVRRKTRQLALVNEENQSTSPIYLLVPVERILLGMNLRKTVPEG